MTTTEALMAIRAERQANELKIGALMAEMVVQEAMWNGVAAYTSGSVQLPGLGPVQCTLGKSQKLTELALILARMNGLKTGVARLLVRQQELSDMLSSKTTTTDTSPTPAFQRPAADQSPN